MLHQQKYLFHTFQRHLNDDNQAKELHGSIEQDFYQWVWNYHQKTIFEDLRVTV
jgi:hypothetical protein